MSDNLVSNHSRVIAPATFLSLRVQLVKNPLTFSVTCPSLQALPDSFSNPLFSHTILSFADVVPSIQSIETELALPPLTGPTPHPGYFALAPQLISPILDEQNGDPHPRLFGNDPLTPTPVGNVRDIGAGLAPMGRTFGWLASEEPRFPESFPKNGGPQLKPDSGPISSSPMINQRDMPFDNSLFFKKESSLDSKNRGSREGPPAFPLREPYFRPMEGRDRRAAETPLLASPRPCKSFDRPPFLAERGDKIGFDQPLTSFDHLKKFGRDFAFESYSSREQKAQKNPKRALARRGERRKIRKMSRKLAQFWKSDLHQVRPNFIFKKITFVNKMKSKQAREVQVENSFFGKKILEGKGISQDQRKKPVN